MSLEKIKIWAVTDGSRGMISQVMGLSNQISKNITEIHTDLIFPWNKIQPGFLPIYKLVKIQVGFYSMEKSDLF